jgi:H+/Cl- antiporter ClcA
MINEQVEYIIIIIIIIIITIIIITIIIIITQSFLRQVRSLFQSEFSRQCHLPCSSIFSLPQSRAVAAYVFFLVLSYLLCFPH